TWVRRGRGMELTGDQVAKFVAALLDAFPTRLQLAQMVRFQLNKNLDALALGDDLQEIVFNLVQKAEAQGWIAELLFAARTSNPGNPALLEFSQQLSPIPTGGGHGYEAPAGGGRQTVQSYRLRSP